MEPLINPFIHGKANLYTLWQFRSKKNGGRRRKCKTCSKQWRIALNQTKKLKKSAEQWILDRSTLRRIQEKTDIHFSTKWRQAQKYADYIHEPIENLRKKILNASKILLLDGKYVSILGESVCVQIAYDTGIGVVDFWVDDTENKTAYGYILRRLKDLGYEPICVVSDDHASISPLLDEEKIPHQLCIFHLLRTLRKLLTGNHKFTEPIPPQYQVMYSRIKGIFKTNHIEDIPKRINNFRKLQIFWQTPKEKYVLNWFWQTLPNAIMHLSFEENVPRTSNLLENLNGQIEQRLKTFRGVKSEQSLNKILKILFFLRNFKQPASSFCNSAVKHQLSKSINRCTITRYVL